MEPTDRSPAALPSAADGADGGQAPGSRRPYVAPSLVQIDLSAATQVKTASVPEATFIS